MKYILTITAKQKNAKRHIVERSADIEKLKRSAEHINAKYKTEIYNGNWELVEIIK